MQADDFPGGTVWLVGAGPGDPELLTCKAERLLRRATIVFHDALVGQGVLDLIATGRAPHSGRQAVGAPFLFARRDQPLVGRRRAAGRNSATLEKLLRRLHLSSVDGR